MSEKVLLELIKYCEDRAEECKKYIGSSDYQAGWYGNWSNWEFKINAFNEIKSKCEKALVEEKNQRTDKCISQFKFDKVI